MQTVEPQVSSWDSTSGTWLYGGKTTQNTYNAFGERTRQSVLLDASTNTWAHTRQYYNKLGQETASIDALGYLSERSYDRAGQIAQERQWAKVATNVSDSGYSAPQPAQAAAARGWTPPQSRASTASRATSTTRWGARSVRPW